MMPEELLRLLVALLVGGALGLEREFRDKAAGFRTLIFISMGAALFTILSARLAGGDQDATRIASNIVTGIGFLGAGVILRQGGQVTGLTTAAVVWLAAALGMAAGGGEYTLSLTATAVALVVLLAFPLLESWVNHRREERTYEVVCSADPAQIEAVAALFRASGLRVMRHRQQRIGERFTGAWKASGPLARHEALVRQLLAHVQVQEFRY